MITNYERITTMSVEEMAKKLFDLTENQCDKVSEDCSRCCFDKMNCCATVEMVKKYLESEVRENKKM